MGSRKLLATAVLLVPAGAAAIEEIVVTTRYRVENLQEVPIAITALTEDTLQKSGVRSLQDIAKLTPSISINEAFSQNDQRITIRGLTNTRGRANVAFLIDGIDVTSETTGTNAGSPLLVNQRLLNDIQRVEIVRGPQSALFGRAAFAGAISYVTAEPGDAFEGRVSSELAQHGSYEIAGMVSGPLGDDLGLRVNGVYWSEDGEFINSASGANVGGGDGRAVSGTLVVRPTDSLKLKARLTWSDDHYDIRPVAIISDRDLVALPVPAGLADILGIAQPADPLVVRGFDDTKGLDIYASEDPLTGGEYPGSDLEVLRGTLLADWDIGSFRLTSHTGFTDADMNQRYDLDRQADGRPDVILGQNDVDTIDTTDQLSQELRIATEWDGPLQLTVGGLYWKEERESLNRNLIVVCSTVEGNSEAGQGCLNSGYSSWQQIYADITALDPTDRVPTRGDTDHWSVYGLVEWKPTDRLTITLEDRYVNEDFSAELFIGSGIPGDGSSVSTCSNFFPDAGPNMTLPVDTNPGSPGFNFGCYVGPSQSGTVNTTYHTPKATVDWQMTDDVLLYASVGKGEKPGGISLLSIAAPLPQPFDSFLFEPEILWAYEAGTKTTWNGGLGQLRANAAAFYQDYTDKQVGRVIFPVGGGFPIAVVDNAAAAHVFGVELETVWIAPIDGLSVTLGYTWLDTAYDDYQTETRNIKEIAIQGNCDEVRTPPNAAGNYCVIDYSGHSIELAPEHAFAAQLAWRRPLTDAAEYLAEMDVRYQGEVYTSVNNFTTLEDYWSMDWRIGLEGERWRLIAFLDNVLDDDTVRTVGNNPDFAGGAVGGGLPISPQFSPTVTMTQPRTFGLRLGYEFGQR
ncbi:MAG: TonB-dependent receptor [Gammaproteobacteria bacterium]|nr:TonB-dependent receptor [Gammaproteobacteria bacterium]